MAGIYIHIPFCKQRCNYCDFYKVIDLKNSGRFTEALCRELTQRSNYLNSASVHTIYFGGGTPSVLNYTQFAAIFDTIFQNYYIDGDAEITLEANPDDLSPEYLSILSSLPFNRISIGIQSFNDDELKSVNRRHTANQAIRSVTDARKAGFQNISIDLIYGLPGQNMEQWKTNLKQAFTLEPEHISAYGLTYEEGTGLWMQRKKGLITETPDEVMLQMYRFMLLQMNEKGYEAYEISNFAKPGFRSQHNSSYWQMIPYLGAGPSAHSFNGNERHWNISSLVNYMKALESGSIYTEGEQLTENDACNEYIMVRLRTLEGIDTEDLLHRFGTAYFDWLFLQAEKYIQSGHLNHEQKHLFLTPEGIEISNIILSHLMKTD